ARWSVRCALVSSRLSLVVVVEPLLNRCGSAAGAVESDGEFRRGLRDVDLVRRDLLVHRRKVFRRGAIESPLPAVVGSFRRGSQRNDDGESECDTCKCFHVAASTIYGV